MANSRYGQQLDEAGCQPLYSSVCGTVHGSIEKRRAFPHLRLRIPVQVGLSDGQVAVARIYDLSADSIQILCDPVTAQRIHPSCEAVDDGGGPVIPIALRLNSGADVRTQILRCKLFHFLPQSEQAVIISLHFEELNAAQRKVLDALMHATLEPSD